MYGKIFDSIYDGTLVEDWRALVTFQQMIILCDADGVVDMTPSAISRRTSIPIEHIKAGIEVLECEDPYSRTPDENGRRIVRLDEHRPWGWYIVNHNKYKHLQDSDTVREQNRERKRKQREREKCHGLSRDVTDGHAPSRHTDTDTNTDTRINIKAFSEYEKYRKEIKKPLSDIARTKAINILKELSKEEQQKVIDKSIINRWTGLFPDKKSEINDWEKGAI